MLKPHCDRCGLMLTSDNRTVEYAPDKELALPETPGVTRMSVTLSNAATGHVLDFCRVCFIETAKAWFASLPL